MMDKATKIHLFLSGVLTATSILALCFGWHGLVSGVVLISVNIYLVAILFEAFFRSGGKRKIENGILLPKPPRFFSFPPTIWMGLFVVFMVSTSISGFANMYIDSAEVVYVGPGFEVSDLGVEARAVVSAPSILNNKIEALYFSLVTMITLGYGDYLPMSSSARLLVMWQIISGGLLVIGIFPLIISRVTDI